MDFVLWYNSRGKSLKNVQTVPRNNLSYSDSWPIYRSSNPKFREKLYISCWFSSFEEKMIIFKTFTWYRNWLNKFVLSTDKKMKWIKHLPVIWSVYIKSICEMLYVSRRLDTFSYFLTYEYVRIWVLQTGF